MWFLFLLFFHVGAYKEQTFDIPFPPTELGISDSCTLYASPTVGNKSLTVLMDHSGKTIATTSIYSNIFAINQKCDTVVFGFPNSNRGKVIIWKPFRNESTDISPPGSEINSEDYTPDVYRFGFSVDIQGETWVAGAPGRLSPTPRGQNKTFRPDSIGYAFVYQGEELHSCRSMYESVCVPEGGGCTASYISWKRYYIGPNPNADVVNTFQKKCRRLETPHYLGSRTYGGGPLDYNLLAYFQYQQFGYAVALTGELNQTGSSLFISAPGDTHRFMEDNDGRNFGLVYAWDTSPEPSSNSNSNSNNGSPIHWWKPSIKTPIGPPNLITATYRGYGRSIAASNAVLVVSTYPLYQNTKEPFVIIYDCGPREDQYSNCEESSNRGVSINNIPHNALGYLDADDFGYSDSPELGENGYVIAPPYQNDFIGKDIGVAGSNVIIPNTKYRKDRKTAPHVHRFGKDARLRESHPYRYRTTGGSNTQHWVLESHHGNQHKLTHLWPCSLGYTGGKPNDGSMEKCLPCEVAEVSEDGWLVDCDLCPLNRTTYEPAQSTCEAVVPRIWPGLLWDNAVYIMGVILLGGVFALVLLFVCECGCTKARRKRKFYSEVV